MNNILTIDFSIFANKYLYLCDYKEYNNDIRLTNIDFPFDEDLYKNIFNEAFFNLINRLDTQKIHFLFRQENIIKYLSDKKDLVLYNIDFYPDIDDYYYFLSCNNWVKYLIDEKILLSDNYFHLGIDGCINSYFFKEINILNLDYIDEIFICLSPESLSNKYHITYFELLNTISNIKNYKYEPYENFNDNLIYNKETDKKYCYSTLLASDSYLKAVLALNYNIKLTNSNYELVVIVTGDVSETSISLLDLYKIKYIIVEDLINIVNNNKEEFLKVCINQEETKENSRNVSCVINKLYALTLDYEKILFLDADCFLKKNIDYLFDLYDYDFIGLQCILQDRYNITFNTEYKILNDEHKGYVIYAGGFFICKSNKDIFNKMIEEIPLIDFRFVPPDAYFFTKYFPLHNLVSENVLHWDEVEKYWFNESIDDLFKYIKDLYLSKFMPLDYDFGGVSTWSLGGEPINDR